jgi:hypothetical protein
MPKVARVANAMDRDMLRHRINVIPAWIDLSALPRAAFTNNHVTSPKHSNCNLSFVQFRHGYERRSKDAVF